ncbi:zinc finger protein ZAT9 [Cajanus cajan]|uniref:C2H2-type domain-containing protein n=1 Tax=Cajanus cajan TaxID=3821 RepID=A0A151TJF3_CAJCA|nr:zinc finger protein ZAT9 [Cajanus cajan]KYP67163.1 hypothetical protein KK1_013486 [Cajanus cajan]
MERHKCKLCSRTFSNGRALGGHMKSHLATLPLPPKPQPCNSSSWEDEDEDEDEEKALIYYGLRENPKKCFRLADPEFDTGSVVQDRESETESKNPTGRRSKRTRRPANLDQPKRPKLSFMESPEPPALSSVSDTSPEEDVAMCLMMLSRDRWINNTTHVNVNAVAAQGSDEIKLTRVRGNHHRCHGCHKTFRSSRALDSHTSVCQGLGNHNNKIYQCPFCSKVFGSGQALGGHKRSHLVPSSSSNLQLKESFIDLNLPAPADEDDLSVLSDA